jgi:hypothetical protein
VKITSRTVARNSADYGGGISIFRGPLTVTDSTLSENAARFDGDAIDVVSSGTVTVRGSTLPGNAAGEYGGGIYIGYYSTVTLTSSAVTGNKAQAGGGIYNYGYANLLFLDASTLDALLGNNYASQSDPDIFGPFTLI